MHLYRGMHNLPPLETESVVTIGNFDGVHLGHQAILEQVRETAAHNRLKSIVLMFEPQPLEFFKGDAAPVRLTRLREKLILMKDYGIDHVVCLTFNRAFARMSADEFVGEILVGKLRVKSVIVGEDFRYGHARAGALEDLVRAGAAAGFEVTPACTMNLRDRRVSSSWVREALSNPDMETVQQLLGRRYSLCGRVIRGDRRGRELGFPTANVSLERNVSPLQGVFATVVMIDDQTRMQAVTNIGERPVFGGGPMLMESHLLDSDQDLYGRLITVEIHKHLRQEQKFDSIASLKEQIDRDILTTRDYFSTASM
ncbi:MAG: bifunctional riboflavin kinase/FAD synthetase [Thiotrichales bacterium]|nr:bifunctional riboflavin kinase/FAD synthetase [Thiotrichales bacterium]